MDGVHMYIVQAAGMYQEALFQNLTVHDKEDIQTKHKTYKIISMLIFFQCETIDYANTAIIIPQTYFTCFINVITPIQQC